MRRKINRGTHTLCIRDPVIYAREYCAIPRCGHCANPAVTAKLWGGGTVCDLWRGPTVLVKLVDDKRTYKRDIWRLMRRRCCSSEFLRAHLLSIRSCPATGQPIFLILKGKKKKRLHTSHGLIYLSPSPVSSENFCLRHHRTTNNARGPSGKIHARQRKRETARHRRHRIDCSP